MEGKYDITKIEGLVAKLLGLSERLDGRISEDIYLAACWAHSAIKLTAYKDIEGHHLPEPEINADDIETQLKQICIEVNNSVMPMVSRPLLENALVLIQGVFYMMNKKNGNEKVQEKTGSH